MLNVLAEAMLVASGLYRPARTSGPAGSGATLQVR